MDLSSKFDSYRSLFNEYECLCSRLRTVDYFLHEFSISSKVFSNQSVSVSWLDCDTFVFPISFDVLIPSLKSYRDEVSSQLDSLSDFFNSLPSYDNKVNYED